MRLLHQGEYARAIEKLKVASELLPQQAQVWNHLGLAYHGAGQPENAIFAYQKALELNRDLAAARFNLGSLYLEQSNLKAAINELTTYTVLQPTSIDGWLQLGTAQLRDRQFDAAERSFNSLLPLQPNHPAALNGLGLVQAQRKKPREAANFFNAAGHYPPALLNLAILSQQQLNNRPFALKKYQEYLALKPKPAGWQTVQALAHQLDQELNPPPAPRPSVTVIQTQFVTITNIAAELPRTNPPPRPALTNTPLLAAIPSNRAPPLIQPAAVPTNRAPPLIQPTAVPTPAPSNPPVVLARIPEETPVKPARDLTTREPAGTAPKPTAPAPAETNPPPATASAPPEAASKPPKGGILDRVNPLNWRIGKSSSPRVTPLPSGTMEIPPPRSNSPSPMIHVPPPEEAAAPAPAPVVPPPVFPRYAYRHPARPPPGNRSEAERLFTEATRAQHERRLSRAIDLYHAALRADPSFFDAYYNLGLASYQAGNWAASISTYETALALEPGSVNARYNFALALQKGGFPRDAADELTRLLAESPKDTRIHLTLGNLYAKELAQPDLARELYLKLLQLDPRHPEATAVRYWLANHP